MATKSTKTSGGTGKSLMIVESPAKAKTIEKFLDNKFIVKSSYGHIRDLPKNDKAIDFKNNFEPQYEISPDKTAVVSELKKLAKNAQEVWLATDEDREGEAISWHLCEALGLDATNAKRIVFHEITKKAIKEAVENPRTINIDLVNAQQARRILDRIVGFELSPILWRKISNKNGLSAGRVQSVAVRLIVDREREINNFNSESSFKLVAYFTAKDKFGNAISFKAELAKNKPDEKNAQQFLESCVGADYKVSDIQVKPGKRSSAAPFTTSTLQQEASRKLGFAVGRTMSVAQRLYEAGKITYMRTDSVSLSETAMDAIENEIRSSFGDPYYKRTAYANKTANAQEAHEAIRPSYIENKDTDGSIEEQKLYDLIWKRTIASQMADAEIEKTIARISILKKGKTSDDSELVASGEMIKFDGFLKVYMESTDDENVDESTMLPALEVGQKLDLKEMVATQKFTKATARYTEAMLVKKLEELGIGRPSTYAPTISTIQKREYVERKDIEGKLRDMRIISLRNDKVESRIEKETYASEKGKLCPTDIGMIVTDFLLEYFPVVMDFSFTAEIEKEFDEVSNGNLEWHKMLKDFYKPFHKSVESTLENAKRATGEKELGIDPKSGKPVSARMGRFGPYVQIGKPDDEEKPKIASLTRGQSIETITYEEAMELFKYPKLIGVDPVSKKNVYLRNTQYGMAVQLGESDGEEKPKIASIPKETEPSLVDVELAMKLLEFPKTLGTYDGKDVKVNKGRFGPYVLWNDQFCSLKKGQDLMTITLAEAIVLIEEKQAKIIQDFKEDGIVVMKGRWGAIIKAGRKMIGVPKGMDPETITVEECRGMIGPIKTFKKAAAKKPFAVKKPFVARKTAAKKKVKK